MKYIPFVFILMLSMPSYAGNLGLGISVKDNENTIYVPYSLTDTIFIEGSFLYSERDFSSSNQESKAYEVGVGLFKKFNIQDSLYAYYGGRVNYINAKSELIYATNSSLNIPESMRRTESEQDGFSISPTLGAAYEHTGSFSIAAEIEYYYSDMDTKPQVFNNISGLLIYTGDSTSIRQSGTNTRLVIRYMF